MVFIALTGCKKLSRTFYVDELSMYIRIDEIKYGRYRINIYRTIEHINEDYIDIGYKMSEMPSITMNFPLSDSCHVNIINPYDKVELYCSKNYNIVYPEVDDNKLNDKLAYKNWCDSVKCVSPSINVTVNAYLRELIIWDGHGKRIRKIKPEK